MSKGKIIEVKRHFNMLALAQDDPEVKAWYGQAFRNIGPYWENKTSASGLTFEEQRLLLPELLGIEAEDRDFRRAVTNFYHEFATKVPKEGIKLQIGLKNENEPLSKDNMPISVKDYVHYRHLRGHNDVAVDKESAERHYNKKFYIHDPDGVSKEAVKINDLEDQAMVIYMKYKDDTIKMDQILTVLGVNIRNFKNEDKVLKLKEFAKKSNNLSEYEQKETFASFIKVAEDKDLEYKFLIQEMIGAQYLQRVGNNIVYAETGKPVGDNMADAVLYFRSPKNSRELNLLKSNYISKMKKDASYLPKEEEVEVKPLDVIKESKKESKKAE